MTSLICLFAWVMTSRAVALLPNTPLACGDRETRQSGQQLQVPLTLYLSPAALRYTLHAACPPVNQQQPLLKGKAGVGEEAALSDRFSTLASSAPPTYAVRHIISRLLRHW